MTPASAKAKGRNGQKIVVEAILSAFPELEPDDVRSTAMGQNGADVQLSPAAKRLFPYQVEAKNKATSQIHTYYKQAKTHGDHEPLVVVKMDRDIPLAIVSLKHFMQLLKEKNNNETRNTNQE
jgi:hypothetical protein